MAFVRCSKRRGGTPTGERAALQRAPHPKDAEVGRHVCRRSASFFLAGSELKRSSKARQNRIVRFASYCLVALSFFVDCTTRARIASREQFVFSPRGRDDQSADAWRRASNRSWRNCEHRRPSDRLDSGHGRPGDRRWFCSSKRFACFAFLQFRIFEMRDVAIAHRPKAERARLRQPRPEIIKERSYRRRIEC